MADDHGFLRARVLPHQVGHRLSERAQDAEELMILRQGVVEFSFSVHSVGVRRELTLQRTRADEVVGAGWPLPVCAQRPPGQQLCDNRPRSGCSAQVLRKGGQGGPLGTGSGATPGGRFRRVDRVVGLQRVLPGDSREGRTAVVYVWCLHPAAGVRRRDGSSSRATIAWLGLMSFGSSYRNPTHDSA